jgi:aconitate hydratase
MALAMGLSGDLTFNPITDDCQLSNGKKIKFSPPKKAAEVPEKGFKKVEGGYISPAPDGASVSIRINPESERLQLLDPFPSWDGSDFKELPVLLKAKGKCTTDHISPAGIWLKYRGHLDRISDNIFLGASNFFSAEAGKGTNVLTDEKNIPLPKIARAYKSKNLRWIVVGDENYGEGSSREHAAMSPRYLGAAAVIARGFARIHETNLKKQGVLPLTFLNPKDYDLINEKDRITVQGLKEIPNQKTLPAIVHHSDGSTSSIELKHSLTKEQFEWFKAGSALNALRSKK